MTDMIYGFGALLLVVALWSATASTGTLDVFTAICSALSTRLEITIGTSPILPRVNDHEFLLPTRHSLHGTGCVPQLPYPWESFFQT